MHKTLGENELTSPLPTLPISTYWMNFEIALIYIIIHTAKGWKLKKMSLNGKEHLGFPK